MILTVDEIDETTAAIIDGLQDIAAHVTEQQYAETDAQYERRRHAARRAARDKLRREQRLLDLIRTARVQDSGGLRFDAAPEYRADIEAMPQRLGAGVALRITRYRVS